MFHFTPNTSISVSLHCIKHTWCRTLCYKKGKQINHETIPAITVLPTQIRSS